MVIGALKDAELEAFLAAAATEGIFSYQANHERGGFLTLYGLARKQCQATAAGSDVTDSVVQILVLEQHRLWRQIVKSNIAVLGTPTPGRVAI